MNSKKRINFLLIIIFLLVICSATSIGYIIGNSNSVSNPQKIPTLIPNDNAIINPEIDQLKSAYNSKIAEKTANYKELEMEKERVQELLFELEKAKGDANSLLKYKNHYQDLETKMLFLIDEIIALKNNKAKAVSKVITLNRIRNGSEKVVKNVKLTSAKPTLKPLNSKTEVAPSKTEGLVVKNELIPEEKNQVKEVAEWNVTNLETIGYKSKSSSKNEITSIANRVDFIKISFTVSGNSSAIGDEKKYYIQVINSKNNVLGTKITENMDGKTLSYSMSKTIQYEGQSIPVIYDLIDQRFEKGVYYINIFERTKLVAKTKFYLN